MPPTLEVAAAIIRHDNRVLACRRRADQPHPHKWEFPGGKREAGESIEQCLRRELHEELGIDAEPGDVVWRTEHTYPGRAPVALVFFALRGYRGELVNRAFAEIRWVEIAELDRLDFLDADRALIERLAGGGLPLPAI